MTLRIAIVHDYLTQRGGAERVALAMLRCFPGSVLHTTIYNPRSTFPEFLEYDVRTTRLNDFPAFREDPRRALPFLSGAISSLDIGDADVVLASTSGWAHGVRTSAPIVAYCHTPARWLYEGDDYFKDKPTWVRSVFGLASPVLRGWDKAAAARVSTYVANSSVVARRVESVYGIKPALVHPPSALSADGPTEPVVGLEPGYLLTLGRKRGYKNLDVVCSAVAEQTDRRLVVVGDLPAAPTGNGWGDRVTALQGVSDAQLRWLYGNCSAVVAMSHEDFGLTPVEGFAFGKPAVALGAGGYLDSCSNERVAVLVPELSPTALAEAVSVASRTRWDGEYIKAYAERFSIETFSREMDSLLQVVGSRSRAIPFQSPRVKPTVAV